VTIRTTFSQQVPGRMVPAAGGGNDTTGRMAMNRDHRTLNGEMASGHVVQVAPTDSHRLILLKPE